MSSPAERDKISAGRKTATTDVEFYTRLLLYGLSAFIVTKFIKPHQLLDYVVAGLVMLVAGFFIEAFGEWLRKRRGNFPGA